MRGGGGCDIERGKVRQEPGNTREEEVRQRDLKEWVIGKRVGGGGVGEESKEAQRD